MERSASELLETAVIPFFHSLNSICVFTVVSNIQTGLEFTEHTCYDVILINHDLSQGIDAVQFGRIFRNIGAQTPIILVKEEVSSDLLEADGGSLFCCLLQKPFSARVLFEAILFGMKQNILSLTRAHSIKNNATDISPGNDTKAHEMSIDNNDGTFVVQQGNSALFSPPTTFHASKVDPFPDINIDRSLLYEDFDLVFLSNCDNIFPQNK